MIRPARLASFFLLASVIGAAPEAEVLRPPSGPGATAAHASLSATGARVVLSWIERLDPSSRALYTAFLAPGAEAWSPAVAVTVGDDLVTNAFDTPQVVHGHEGRALAVWLRETDRGAQAWTALSTDDGLTWHPPRRLSTETAQQEFPAVTALPDGRFLAAWLDGRSATDTALYSRIVGTEGPDALVDHRVCDCCALALTTFPDGSVVLIYRDRSDNETRDHAQARWSPATGWQREQVLPTDGWVIAGCPVNGPALSRVGIGLGLVWFTVADGEARVLAATSNQAGRQWSVGYQLSPDRAAGRVAGALLRNGSLWASWVDAAGAIQLRELRPGGRPGEVFPGPAESTGVPRLLVSRDEAGKPVQLLQIFETKTADPLESRLVTRRLTLPAPEITLSDDCGCDPVAAVGGIALRGSIVAVDPVGERVTIRHPEITGFALAMDRTVRVDVRLLTALTPGQSFFGRLEQRDDGDWWLFDLRLMRRPDTP